MLNEHEIEKLYFSISELSEILHVSATAIRFWEEKFGIFVTRRSRGRRSFSKKEVDKFKQIYQLLKVEGYTIPGAKRKLNG